MAAAGVGSLSRAFGANAPSETIGIGIIGVGGKGTDHLKELLGIAGAEIRGISDVYTARLDRALTTVRAKNPSVKGYPEYRELLASKDIDAVVIATPDHWHSKITIDAADAGKDVYVEKGMTRTLPEAKAMVEAVKRNKRVMQLGHQRSSSPVSWKVREIHQAGTLGHVSLVTISRFRNSKEGEWNYRIAPDAGPHNINWDKFLGSAPKRPYDADRFFRWRKYWDYGTGISGDLLSHEWNAVNLMLGMGIPKTCVASGGIYYWTDGREVPDVLNVLYEYPEKDLSLTFSSTFSNSRAGRESETRIFGRNATIEITKDLAMFLEPYGDKNLQAIDQAREKLRQSGAKVGKKDPVPVLTYTREQGQPFSTHMQNWIDCVRSRERTRCNEDDGFEEAVILVMSVISYQEKRMVTWDPVRKEIV